MLVHSLRSHPDIVCHGEVFGPDKSPPLFGLDLKRESPLRDKLLEIREQDPTFFLNEFVFYAGKVSAVGLKFKYEEFTLPQYRKVFQTILDDKDIRVIHLTRINLLQRYVSQVVATRITKRFNTTNPTLVPKSVRLKLPPQECEKEFSFTKQRQDHFKDCFRHHQVMELTYEELVTRYDDTMASVQEFLEVDEVPLQSKTQKMLSEDLGDILDNYSEIQEHFRNTRYATYCL
jgi:hypothetical protein